MIFSKVLKLLHCFQLSYYFNHPFTRVVNFFIARFSFNDKHIASKYSPFLLTTIHFQEGNLRSLCKWVWHPSVYWDHGPVTSDSFSSFLQFNAYFYQSIEQKRGEDFYGISHSPYSISLLSTLKIFSNETVKIDNACGWCHKTHVDQRDVFVFNSRSSYSHCLHLKLFSMNTDHGNVFCNHFTPRRAIMPLWCKVVTEC